ncbi:MAG: flagellar filament capping protein FliD [Lachnospiraceae bacterium]|nr:flagellar filament capping protein FliD [Lachnospiraceae bacterium]
MAGIYGLNAYSNLFGSSSLFSTSSSSSSSSVSSMYGNLSQYSSVKSGAYFKATKAYYNKMSEMEGKSTTKKKSIGMNDFYGKINQSTKMSESSKNISAAKTEANELIDSAKKLTDTGKDSLFASKDKPDKDAIYKAANEFVTNYNETMDALKKVNNTNVKSAGDSMTRMTSALSKSLSKVGITVGTDNKLAIDEDTFKKADVNEVKKLFNGSGSYAGIISSSATRLSTQAVNEISGYSQSLYSNNGSYLNNYNSINSGLFYEGFF